MKKNFKYYSVIWLISLVIFNVIVFVTPNEAAGMSKFGGAFWVGYIFITIAFLGQLACALKAFKEENLQKVFYNIPLISISYTGLIAMLIAGTACMVIPNIPNWMGIIICMSILALSGTSIIKASVAADIVGKIDEKIKTQTQFIKMLTVDSQVLITSTINDELKAEAKKVYESIRYSDPMSNPALDEAEAQIQKEFVAFADAVKAEDLEVAKVVASELLNKVESRNKKCKMLK